MALDFGTPSNSTKGNGKPSGGGGGKSGGGGGSNPFGSFYESSAPPPASSGGGGGGSKYSSPSFGPTSGTSKLAPAPAVQIDLELSVPDSELLLEQSARDEFGMPITSLVDSEEAKADALQIQQREERKEDRAEARYSRPRRTHELTWEQYEALSPQQKAAVDFNGELIEARQTDLTTDYKEPSGKAEKRYEQTVQRMFGKDGGSVAFAPETVALLNQINYNPGKEGVGSDLDDFLGLKAAVTAKDLKTLGLGGEDPMPLEAYTAQSPITDKTALQQTLADKTAHLEKSMAKAGTLLQDFSSSVDLERNSARKYFGVPTHDVETPTGWGNDNADVYFQKIFEAFANKGVDNDAVWADFNAQLPESDPNRQRFFEYADTLTQQASDYRIKLGSGVEGQKYYKSGELREVLGLGQGD